MTRSVEFFENQFRRQLTEGDFSLNPFEALALDHVFGDTLDLGCGLGNLALESARRGCRVTAVDISSIAVERIRKAAFVEGLPVTALTADLAAHDIEGDFDVVLAIGILMFFPPKRAHALLRQVCSRVRPGGVAVVNVLVEGTSFLDMFEPGGFHLFSHDELRKCFSGWPILAERPQDFAAPGGTVKSFVTLVAKKPNGA